MKNCILKKAKFICLVLCGMLLFCNNVAQCELPLTIGDGFTFSESTPITVGTLNEYPSITSDKNGTLWIAWMGVPNKLDGKEAIYIMTYNDGDRGEVQQVSEKIGFEFRPRIICDNNNKIWVVWSAKRDNNWDIYARCYDVNVKKWFPEMKLTSDINPDMNPAITVDNKNRIWVAWESLTRGNFDIKVSFFDGTEWSEERVVSEQDSFDLRPSIVADNTGKVWVAWDGYKEDYDIFLCNISSKKVPKIIRVTNHPAYDQAPSLALDSKNRLWIAYHSNRVDNTRVDDPKVGIPKWTYLLCYEGNKFYEPATPMKDKDLDNMSEIQGFEFPQLLIDDSDRIWIFGRPSQSFVVQYYHGDKWSDLVDISNPPALPGEPVTPDWGGRGDYVQSVKVGEKIYTVRRDTYANKIRVIENIKKDFKPAVVKPVTIPSGKKGLRIKDNRRIEKTGEYNLFFGELHAHSALSDGMGTVDELYPRSRDVYGWDFAALTDHDWFVGNKILLSEWEYMKMITKEFNQPGKFVTIPSHEWTGARVAKDGPGHKNVYFYDDDPPLYSLADEHSNTPVKLYELLKQHKAIAIPHHIGWTGVDWETLDPEVTPVIEVVSKHGVFEYFGNLPIPHRGGTKGYFIQDGLKKGLVFGLIGGSDGHGLIWHHGISYKYDPWKGGLCAVLSKNLAREEILDAIKSRRCYATSGAKIIINFTIDEHLMGEIYETNKPPEIDVYVKGTERLKYVYVIRNNEEIWYSGRDLELGYGSKIQFVDNEITEGRSYYYIRVIQNDNEMAFSSPIWVNYKPDKKQ